jgi:hypothetical protein
MFLDNAELFGVLDGIYRAVVDYLNDAVFGDECV